MHTPTGPALDQGQAGATCLFSASAQPVRPGPPPPPGGHWMVGPTTQSFFFCCKIIYNTVYVTHNRPGVKCKWYYVFTEEIQSQVLVVVVVIAKKNLSQY